MMLCWICDPIWQGKIGVGITAFLNRLSGSLRAIDFATFQIEYHKVITALKNQMDEAQAERAQLRKDCSCSCKDICLKFQTEGVV